MTSRMTMPIEGTRSGKPPTPRRRHLQLLRDGREAAAPVVEGPRRLLNLVVALAGIIITFPLWIVIAILIKLTSRGPVFYDQTRVGLDQRQAKNPCDERGNVEGEGHDADVDRSTAAAQSVHDRDGVDVDVQAP